MDNGAHLKKKVHYHKCRWRVNREVQISLLCSLTAAKQIENPLKYSDAFTFALDWPWQVAVGGIAVMADKRSLHWTEEGLYSF